MGRQRYRPGSQHPEEYRQDLNPDALAGENLPRSMPVVSAADIKAVADRWPQFNDAELRQIPVVRPGTRLE